jgi:hypothetical protein
MITVAFTLRAKNGVATHKMDGACTANGIRLRIRLPTLSSPMHDVRRPRGVIHCLSAIYGSRCECLTKSQLVQCKNTATIHGEPRRFQADVVQVLEEVQTLDFAAETKFKN